MSLKLYLDANSQPCRAIVILCKMNGIEYEEELVSFVYGTTRSEEFRKINPHGKVPVLEEGDFILTESVAIMQYLLSTRPVAENWYPAEPRARARVHEFLMATYCPDGLRMNSARVFIEQALIPIRSGKPVDEVALKERIAVYEVTADKLENYFMKKGPYIGGCTDVTIADLVAICELMQPKSVGFDVIGKRPKLAAWFEKTKERLQPHFDEIHRSILALSGEHQMK